MDNQKITRQNTVQKQGELKRDMKMRHLLMIAYTLSDVCSSDLNINLNSFVLL